MFMIEWRPVDVPAVASSIPTMPGSSPTNQGDHEFSQALFKSMLLCESQRDHSCYWFCPVTTATATRPNLRAAAGVHVVLL